MRWILKLYFLRLSLGLLMCLVFFLVTASQSCDSAPTHTSHVVTGSRR
jgi:hypothetical protein